MTKNKKPFEISFKSNSKNILIEISKPCDVNQIKFVDKLIKIISDAVKNEDIKSVSYTHLTLPTICSV